MELYDAKSLDRLVAERSESLGKSGTSTNEDWLAVSAAYALDLYHLSEDARNGAKLDFTFQTKDNTDALIGPSHYQLLLEGKSASESREILAKRLAAYLLFSTYNDLCVLELEPTIEASPTSMLLTVSASDGITYSFDFLKRARFAMSRFSLSDQGEDFSTGGTLAPLYDKLYRDMMLPVLTAEGLVK